MSLVTGRKRAWGPVVKYLRLRKLVKVPPEWKALIPK